MIDRGGQLRLANESFSESPVFGKRRGEELECDLPLQTRVLREVHDAHAAAADDPVDPVAGELRPRSEVGSESTGHRGRDGFDLRPQLGVVVQDLLVQVLQLGRWI